MCVLLYNILLLINHYIGNSTIKCHSRSLSDNRDLTETFHQKIFFTLQGHYISLLDISNPHEYPHNVTKFSILPLPGKAV